MGPSAAEVRRAWGPFRAGVPSSSGQAGPSGSLRPWAPWVRGGHGDASPSVREGSGETVSPEVPGGQGVRQEVPLSDPAADLPVSGLGQEQQAR